MSTTVLALKLQVLLVPKINRNKFVSMTYMSNQQLHISDVPLCLLSGSNANYNNRSYVHQTALSCDAVLE